MCDHRALSRARSERSPGGALRSSRRLVRVCVTLALLLFCLGVTAPPVAAQKEDDPRENESATGVLVFTLEHQPAAEALALVRRLLSPQGNAELRPDGDTLVIRDARARLARLEPVLEQFDHPPQGLRFDIHLLRAGHGDGAIDERVPADVADRLREYLRYSDYRLVAGADVTFREGEEVVYALGDGYSLSFRVGTVLAEQRLKLHDFRLHHKPRSAASTNKSRQPDPRELLDAGLNLERGRLFTMILARDSGPEKALVVALRFRLEDDAAKDER